MKTKDRELLQNKFNEYSSLLEKGGVGGLQLRVSSLSIPDASRFLVRYQSSSGQTLFLHVPESLEIVGWTISLQQLDSLLNSRSKYFKNSWIGIPGPDYGDDVEIISKHLKDGGVLQVGKDTEDREEFLEEFIKSFTIGLIPVMSLAILVGFFLSGRILSPIRWLTETVLDIRKGQSGARVPLSGNQDELDNLGLLFNQMQDQNEKLVKGMKQTLDHVAHDLRTPIMRIQNSAQKILEKTNLDDNSPVYEALVDSQENSETILKMLNAIMDISEVETGTMILQMEVLELSKLVESVLDIYSFIAEEKEIGVTIEIPTELYIKGDKGRLLQAFANVIDNAIKYTPNKRSIHIKGYRSSGAIVLDISDEGPGIPEADQSRIWDRLYRGDQSRSTRGLGLGLSFVQAIAQAHDSHVQIENNQSLGCTFRFIFST